MKKWLRRLGALLSAAAVCAGVMAPAGAFDADKSGTYVAISCGDGFTAAVDANGILWTWGDNEDGELGNGVSGTDERSSVPVRIMDSVISVSCGANYAAALKSDHTLWMWGFNGHGELCNKNLKNCSTPVQVMEDVIAVSCGEDSTGVIKTDGSLWMWGSVDGGKLGNGGKYDSTINGGQYQVKPTKIMSNALAVSCGANNTAAILKDGSLWVWGDNTYGQVGTGSKGHDITVPTKIMDNVVTVSLGGNHTAAIKTDGSLWVWGSNVKGQIGNGGTGNDEFYYSNQLEYNQTTPERIMTQVASVSCGLQYTVAVKKDGTVWAWGDNTYGELGNGTTTNASSPLKIMSSGSAVAARGATAVVKTDGSLWMWGNNRWGQLGNGGTGNAGIPPVEVYQTVPVKVMSNMAVTKPATVAGFTDVYESDYYADAVIWAKEKYVTTGTTATTFSPKDTVIRADAITFLWRAYGSPNPTYTKSKFTDVTDKNAYYYKAVLWATEKGITNGEGNNKFGVRDTLTYDQMLAFLCRAAGGRASGTKWSAQALNWAKDQGLTDGLSFTATNSCPRADTIYCIWKQMVK